MKKRKAPIVLISILIIFGVAVTLMNQPKGTGPAQGESPVAGKTDEVPSPENLAKLSGSPSAAPSSNGNFPTPAPAKQGPRHGLPIGADPVGVNGPVSGQKPTTMPKPKPDPNSISTQWYTPEAKHGK